MGFCSIFDSELADVIPVIKTSIGGTRIIGRLCVGKQLTCFFNLSYDMHIVFEHWLLDILYFVGNKKGLLLPHTTTDQGTLYGIVIFAYPISDSVASTSRVIKGVGFIIVLHKFQ